MRCIASHVKSDSEGVTKKKQLTVFFEDIAQTMVKFSDVDLAETKREIFNLLNKKQNFSCRNRFICSHFLTSTNNTCQSLLYTTVIIHHELPSQMNHQQPSKVSVGFFPRHFHMFPKTCQQIIIIPCNLEQNELFCLLLTHFYNALLISVWCILYFILNSHHPMNNILTLSLVPCMHSDVYIKVDQHAADVKKSYHWHAAPHV